MRYLAVILMSARMAFPQSAQIGALGSNTLPSGSTGSTPFTSAPISGSGPIFIGASIDLLSLASSAPSNSTGLVRVTSSTDHLPGIIYSPTSITTAPIPGSGVIVMGTSPTDLPSFVSSGPSNATEIVVPTSSTKYLSGSLYGSPLLTTAPVSGSGGVVFGPSTDITTFASSSPISGSGTTALLSNGVVYPGASPGTGTDILLKSAYDPTNIVTIPGSSVVIVGTSTDISRFTFSGPSGGYDPTIISGFTTPGSSLAFGDSNDIARFGYSRVSGGSEFVTSLSRNIYYDQSPVISYVHGSVNITYNCSAPFSCVGLERLDEMERLLVRWAQAKQ